MPIRIEAHARMTNPLARLARMSPTEIGTRAHQALSKRWATPPSCRLVTTSTRPVYPAPPPNASVPQAEKICRHRLDLLGYQDLDFGSPPDWHLDPVHHKHAPRIPWYKIPFLDFTQVGDHKIIWELNRHQHLVTLAQAWRCTNDDRFAAEIRAQWHDWQRQNPYPIGINWASSLEVGFRALSWLWVRQLLGDSSDEWLPALHVHGWHIERYLSTYFSPNTHLLGEGVSLFAIGLLCPQLADAPRWRRRGWAIVQRQAETQVRADGFHFEQSVYYHIYALDFFRYARELAARNGIFIPVAFDQTIAKMSDALAALSQAGPPPRFGDDDGGRVIGNFAPPSAPQPRRSVALPGAGIYAMTSSRSQLFIDAGPLGSLAGGHGHADALSVQLTANGRPMLIDPGACCYTCPERDRFRGTAAHNTLQIDGRDQAEPAGPFAWKSMPETIVDRWHTAEDCDFFAGHHGMHHRSVVGLKSKFWLVRDTVTGAGTHRLDIHWHYLDVRDLAILPPAGHTWSQTTERWDWSPIYGKKEPAYVLRFTTETTLPAEFAVLLVLDPNPGLFTQVAPAQYRYEDADGSHEFLFTGPRFQYRHGAREISL
jgi:hypothetical protein